MDGQMQVNHKAGLQYMCMYGKVAQCIYHIIIIVISTHIIGIHNNYNYIIQVQNDECTPGCSIPHTLLMDDIQATLAILGRHHIYIRSSQINHKV